MNKEFIVRGKRVDNGKWVQGGTLIQTEIATYVLPSGADVQIEKDNMQNIAYIQGVLVAEKTASPYTGILDKHKNKIFVGDVVQIGNQIGEVCFRYGTFGIRFKGAIDFFRFKFDDNFISFMDLLYFFMCEQNICDKVEIIGNKWEDFNLLN